VLKRKAHYVIVVIAMLLIVAVMSTTAWLDYYRERAIRQEQDMRALMNFKTEMDRNFIQRLRLTDGIVAFIQMQQSTDRELLDSYFVNLVNFEDRVIRNIAVLKDTTIRYQYPFDANQSSIGVDLLAIPEQRDAILEAMLTLNPTVNGPINLVQGGRGVVVRVPIAIDSGDSQTFWGLVSLVLDYDYLIEELMTEQLLEQYYVSVEKLNSTGQTTSVFYTTGAPMDDAIYFDIPFLSEYWRLSLVNRDALSIPPSSYLLVAVGILLSLLVGYLLRRTLVYQANLNEEVTSRTKQLRETNEILEQYVAEFEEKQAELELVNDQLESSLDELKSTQQQLIMTEKLAALGDLVSSLAHEINTPLGVCVTLYSFIQDNLDKLSKSIKEHEQCLDRLTLDAFVQENTEALMLMGHNLKRSSELVSSFKLVSMDQYLEEYRIVNIAHYLEEIVNSIRPKYKRIDHMLTVDVDPKIRLYTYPGAISQIVTNLINNSIVHGFDGKQVGTIKLIVEKSKLGYIKIIYRDSGVGLQGESREKLFTPFFTTKKQKGSSGLGMHIVYNAVVNTLGGTIEVMDLTSGFGVVMEVPIQVERDTVVE